MSETLPYYDCDNNGESGVVSARKTIQKDGSFIGINVKYNYVPADEIKSLECNENESFWQLIRRAFFEEDGRMKIRLFIAYV